MNKEDYVSLQVAKLLKEKGFKQKCEEKYIVEDKNKSRQEWDDKLMCYKTFYDTIEYPKPTIYQAAKWLRNKHNIHIPIYWDIDGYNFGLISIDEDGLFIDVTYGDYQKTYEKSLNAGILQALKENLKLL